MKFIPRSLHIVFDILSVAILIGYPILIGVFGVGSICMLVSGIAILCISLLTKYEIAIFKLIDMKTHLTLDFILGIGLIATPWMAGSMSDFLLPNLIAGLSIMIVAVCSKNESQKITKQEEKLTF